MLKKAKRVSLVEQVVQQMEELIEENNWLVGERIPPEMELMDKFGVSRNTLREAIRALVHAGLLETKQGSGTIVRSSSSLSVAINKHIKKSSLFDTLEVRLALEREAALLAAKRRSNEDIEKLTVLIERCKHAIEIKDMEKFIEADMSFHKAIVAAAKNKMLFELYDYMTEHLYESIRDMISIDTDFQVEKEIHSELLQAIKRQDVSGATNYVNQYIHTWKQKLEKVLED